MIPKQTGWSRRQAELGRCRRCGEPAPGAGHCDPCKAFRAQRAREQYATRAIRKLTLATELVLAGQRGFRLGYAAGVADTKAGQPQQEFV